MAIAPSPYAQSAQTLVTMALRDSGYLALGQSAPAQITNEAFIRLNWILSTWAAKRWLAWDLIDLAFTPTVSQKNYTVSSGGQFNFPGDYNPADFSSISFFTGSNAIRPVQVESAYVRLNAQSGIPTDYQLELIPSYEDYSKIVLKTMTNFPRFYFYDPAYPVGLIYFWPLPLIGQELHILVRNPLGAFATLNDALYLPPEYAPALSLTLAVWLRMAAKMPPDPALNALARDAVNTIRVNNTQLKALDMPKALIRPGIYNILADEFH